MGGAQRHATAFQVALVPWPLQQGAVAALVAVALFAAIAALAAHDARGLWLLLLTPLASGLAWHGARVAPRYLQWDGQTWRLAPADLHEPGPAVELAIALDFGACLLLRARVRASPWWASPIYLPLSRGRVGAAWGQLRATLYSARPHDPTVDEAR